MSRILVVDDDVTLVEGIRAMLDVHEIKSEGAWDCDLAEQLVAGQFFQVILADLRMRSEEDGLRLIEAVRRISPRSRVATMTGYADEATEARLRVRLGAGAAQAAGRRGAHRRAAARAGGRRRGSGRAR